MEALGWICLSSFAKLFLWLVSNRSGLDVYKMERGYIQDAYLLF